MKGFEFGLDSETGDVYLETPDGEYVQWLPGEDVDVIALTADGGNAVEFVMSIRESYGLPADPDTAVVIMRAEKPQFMPASESVDLIKSSIDYLDFFKIDCVDFSVAWASPEKMKELAPKFGGHGEISLTGKNLLQSKAFNESLLSGTPSIRSDLDEILARVTQTQLT